MFRYFFLFFCFVFVNSNDTSKIHDGDDTNHRDKIFETQTVKKNILTLSQLLFLNTFNKLKYLYSTYIVNRGGGGVGIIHKESISRASSSQHEASSFESLSCDLTFKDSLSPIKLVILYRPHYSKKHRVTAKVFLDEFSEYVSSLTTSTCKLLIVGDFNLHMDVPTDRDANRLKDILSSSNLSQFVTEPTHISGHILDLVIARSDDNVVDSVTVPFLFTDHAVIHCLLYRNLDFQRK